MLARTAGHEGARFNVARHSDRTAPVARPLHLNFPPKYKAASRPPFV